ncbi:MAG: hypothetical protein HYU87_09040 [Chloroflexi bacterium]|nr:hypothetical protein [Chloroflexota bacterium]
MDDVRGLLVLLHVASALFMAAPLYMLVIVNERARLGAPLGLPHDAFFENIVRRQPIRCYAYLAVLTVSGVALAVWPAGVVGLFVPSVLVKLGATAALFGILSYVHFSLQPRIDAQLATFAPGTPATEEAKRILPALRTRRKRMAATCLFLVLVAAIFGVRLSVAVSPLATAIVVLLALALAWRAYRTGVRYGYA